MKRAVIVAVDMRDGLNWNAQRLGLTQRDIAIITPHSRHAARGFEADAVVVTDAAIGLNHSVLTELVDIATVCRT